MNEYICRVCGKSCFSAATSTKFMKNPHCPYCKGEITDLYEHIHLKVLSKAENDIQYKKVVNK